MLLDLGHARPTIVYKNDKPHLVVYFDQSPGKIVVKKTRLYEDCLELLHKNAALPRTKNYITMGNNAPIVVDAVNLEDFDGRTVHLNLFVNHYLTLTKAEITDFSISILPV